MTARLKLVRKMGRKQLDETGLQWKNMESQIKLGGWYNYIYDSKIRKCPT